VSLWFNPVGSELAATGEGAAKRHLIGIFEVAADRQAARRARDADAEWIDGAEEVHRRRLAVRVRVHGEDYFFHIRPLQADEELAHAQLIWPDPLDGVDRPVQHMIEAVVLARPLQCDEIERLLDVQKSQGSCSVKL
jgi:hypothetical protein